MRPASRPVHLLLLHKTPAHHLIDGRFDEGRRDRLALPGSLTVQRVVAGVGDASRRGNSPTGGRAVNGYNSKPGSD